ncbi:MAG TPA: hypothetical protein VEY09_18765 [Pyrinomonadaceae bacterium]|nr:hypothetical protein [Pyrinomonadaceae bacterium]
MKGTGLEHEKDEMSHEELEYEKLMLRYEFTGQLAPLREGLHEDMPCEGEAPWFLYE